MLTLLAAARARGARAADQLRRTPMATSSTGRTTIAEHRSRRRSTEPAQQQLHHRPRINAGVAVDSKFIYWSDRAQTESDAPILTAAASTWTSSPQVSPLAFRDRGHRQLRDLLGNDTWASDTAGHANVDGSNPVGSFFEHADRSTSIVARADTELPLLAQHIGWTPYAIGRAPLSGAGVRIPTSSPVAGRRLRASRSTASFLYWDPGGGNWDRTRAGWGRIPVPGFVPPLSY